MHALRSVAPFFMAIVLAVVAGHASPPAATANNDGRAVVVDFARAQIGKPYKYGATGLARYDCSGLIFRAFAATGMLELIGGKRRSALGTYNWFANRGLVTKNPRPGDIVAWGNPVSHVGIYSGTSGGHAMSVSALVNGVKEHRVHAVTTKFRAYLRVPFDDGEVSGQGDTAPSATSSALPAPFKSTINLRKGSHTLFRLNGSGAVLEQRTINRARPLSVAVDPQVRTFAGRPHVQIKSGKWAGWWRRVPDAGPNCCRHSFPTTRTLRLASGNHLFKSFHAKRTVVIREHVRVNGPTLLSVDVRATFNGKRHFLIADGPLAGKWVAKKAASKLVP